MASITLAKPHRHGETDYERGAVIEVDDETADWIEARGIGVRNADAPKPKTQSKPSTENQE